jgi:lysophospholipase L1-like esterase
MTRARVLAAVSGALAPSSPISVWARLSHAALRFAVVFPAVAVSLVGAEYTARFVFRHAHSSGQAGDFVAARGGGPAIVSNHLGFREREIPPKSPDRYRIVVVGDSFTWGQGIEVGDRFSNLLQDFLGPGYEVFNFARPGNNMPEHLGVLEEALPVSPDFILLQLYINDFETRQMARPQPYPLLPWSLDRDLERSSVLYDLANRQWASWQLTLGVVDSYEQYMARNLRDANAPNSRIAFGMLREFIERSNRAGVACGIVLFPAPDAMGRHGSNYPFGYLHERVNSTCASEQISCLDLLPAFSTVEDPRSMWVSPFDAHPNAMTNRRAAQEILLQFSPIWQRSTE